MGKSIKSKIKRRWRAAKREHLKATVLKDHLEGLKSVTTAIAQGKKVTVPVPPVNGFLDPINGVIPQIKRTKVVDFRCDALLKAPAGRKVASALACTKSSDS